MEKTDRLLHVATFYRFVRLPDREELRESLLDLCESLGLKGTILLAEEGINSTLAGEAQAMASFFGRLEGDPRFAQMERKYSTTQVQPFRYMKVRLKKEIVRMGVAALNPTDAGRYADAASWEALLADPEVVVVDTRNAYEVAMGTFKGAVNPRTEDFQDFPAWADAHLSPKKHKKVAMFCTGGIRCEKSTAYLKSKGFGEVWHLKGGILQYLEDTGNAKGLWRGKCFIFDERGALNDELEPTAVAG